MLVIRFKANLKVNAHSNHQPPSSFSRKTTFILSLFLCAKFSYWGFSHCFISGKFFSQDLEAARVKWFSKRNCHFHLLKARGVKRVWKNADICLNQRSKEKMCQPSNFLLQTELWGPGHNLCKEGFFVDPFSLKKLPLLGCHCLTLLSLHFHSNRNIGEISIAFLKWIVVCLGSN